MKFFKRAAGIAMAASMMFTSLISAAAFSDVPVSDPYAAAIDYVSTQGLMNGYEDGLFHPEDSISRGMLATIIYRMMGSPLPSIALEGFSDVPEWSFYKMASTFVKDTGIMTGNRNADGSYSFDGEDAIRRADLALIFYRLVQNNIRYDEGESDPFIYGTNISFSDTAQSHYAYQALDWAAANDLLERDGAAIHPSQDGTRGVTANFLYRILLALDGVSQPEDSAPAALDYLAPLSRENVLALLDAYDPDGAYILRASNATHDFMNWMSSERPIQDQINLTVHEQTHVLTLMNYGFVHQEQFYIGNGQTIPVTFTPVFDTVEILPTLDPALNELSYRYDTYISQQADPITDSRQNGIYGLFDEFTAYCWGANADLLTWPVYVDYVKQADSGSHWLFSFAGVEYGEFMYWMLSYLNYAYNYYPQTYQQIVGNTAFRQAFTIVDDKFQQVLADQQNLEFFNERDLIIYDQFMEAINSSELQQMYQALRI